jgi:hypothetical protein
MVRVGVDEVFLFLCKSLLVLFIFLGTLLISLLPLLLPFFVVLLFFLSFLFSVFFLLLPPSFFLLPLLESFKLILNPGNIVQQILLILIVIDSSEVFIHVFINSVLEFVSLGLNSLQFSIVLSLDIFNRLLFRNGTFFGLQLGLESVDFLFYGIGLSDLDVQLLLYRLVFVVEKLDLIVEFVDLGLDFDQGLRIRQSPLELVDFVGQFAFFLFANVSRGQVVLLFSDELVKSFSSIASVSAWPSQLFNFGFQKVDFGIDLFLLIVKDSDFLSYLIFPSHFFSHDSRILSVDFSSIFLVLIDVSDNGSLFIKNSIFLDFKSFSLSLQLFKTFFVLLLVGLVQQIFRLFRNLSFSGDIVFVPVKFRSLLSGWSFFFRSLTIWLLFVQLFLFFVLFLNFLLVFGLLLERTRRVDETLFDIFLRHVFWHRIIL